MKINDSTQLWILNPWVEYAWTKKWFEKALECISKLHHLFLCETILRLIDELNLMVVNHLSLEEPIPPSRTPLLHFCVSCRVGYCLNNMSSSAKAVCTHLHIKVKIVSRELLLYFLFFACFIITVQSLI